MQLLQRVKKKSSQLESTESSVEAESDTSQKYYEDFQIVDDHELHEQQEEGASCKCEEDGGTTCFFELDNKSSGEDPFIAITTENCLLESSGLLHQDETSEPGIQTREKELEHGYGQQAIDEDDCMIDTFSDSKAIEELDDNSSQASQSMEAMSTRSSLEVQATQRTLPIYEVEDWPYESANSEDLKRSIRDYYLLKKRLMMQAADISI